MTSDHHEIYDRDFEIWEETLTPVTQNVFMYLDSIVCNVGMMIIKGDWSTAFDGISVAALLQFFVVTIIVNNALIGIVTSLFLKVCKKGSNVTLPQ